MGAFRNMYPAVVCCRVQKSFHSLFQQLFRCCIFQALVGSYGIGLVGRRDEQEPVVKPGLILGALDDVHRKRGRHDLGDESVPITALGSQCARSGIRAVTQCLDGVVDADARFLRNAGVFAVVQHERDRRPGDTGVLGDITHGDTPLPHSRGFLGGGGFRH
ncbi:hypothetical protein AHiyo8_08800 [Arthrobacter sp. Hiyo8]|nr:hypothetical protein AHiyo8_08800 [Arthrobacter sp. Hiyo8]